MTIFEFIFALYSIIVSLALTHVLSGFIDLRRASRVRVSLPHALWAAAAFMMTIGNWATLWDLRLMESWPNWTVLILLATAVGQYVFCTFVTPDTVPGTEADLVAFHEKERHRYIGAFFLLLLFAQVFNFSLGGFDLYSDWLRDASISTLALAVGLLAFFVSARWAQYSAAIVLAALALYFLLAATNLTAA